jgi:hypothetical protein
MGKSNEPELWGVERIAKYLHIGHESVRKALHRKGIRETRGYPAEQIKAAWPDRGEPQ